MHGSSVIEEREREGEGGEMQVHRQRATHIASAVLQIAQDVDEGWPLEILDHHGNAALIYLQPGEMVLYEGASFKHGRPMRFKGNMFANIFTHFAPFER